MRRALAVDPNYYPAISHLGNHDLARNRPETALAAARKARELNPLRNSGSGIMFALIAMKRYEEAISLGRQLIADRPSYNAPRFFLGVALFLNGQQEEGLRALEDVAGRGESDARALVVLGWCYGISGQKDKARAVLKKMQSLDNTRRVAPNWLAAVHVGLGERDRAFELLERAYVLREPSMPFVGGDLTFEPIRDDPRFRSLLKRMKLDVYFPESPAR
jgi:tetratricopeptide (TPR) repeat protein